jgi:adenosylcobinamide-GDP ribazoletransferase
MKDSRHGTYGVAAIGLYLILRVVGFGAVTGVNPLAAGALMIATGILARSGSLWLSVELPPAREGGSSASVGRVSRPSFALGAGFAVMLGFALAAPFVGILGLVFALLATALTAIAWVMVCRRMVGGQSGDLIGALHALIEIAVLTVFMLFA